jgi:hypothetical protein
MKKRVKTHGQCWGFVSYLECPLLVILPIGIHGCRDLQRDIRRSLNMLEESNKSHLGVRARPELYDHVNYVAVLQHARPI